MATWPSTRSETETRLIQRAFERIAPLELYPRPPRRERVRILQARALFKLPWFRRFEGYTIFSCILLKGPVEQASEDLITHEMTHVWQGQHEWVRLWMSYIKPSTFWGDRSGYWDNRYEIEAREAVERTRPSV
jgi:hypothetical protein